MSGALEIYRCAYDISAAIGAARSAVDAARLAGRLTRRRADWAEAERWFRVGYEVAQLAGMDDQMARTMVGLAGITREVGNLKTARTELQAALAVAEKSGEREVVGLVHHALLGLEQQAGDLPTALAHGWTAITSYQSGVSRTRCMAGLAGTLQEYGDHEAAEDAWTVVIHESAEKYYLMYAHNGLAHIAAMRGDRASFETHAARCDALDWENGTPSAKGEILCFRGLAYHALGQTEPARAWLTRAVGFAEQHGYNRLLFLAEDALERVTQVGSGEAAAATPAAPIQVREGLRAMRRDLVGAGV